MSGVATTLESIEASVLEGLREMKKEAVDSFHADVMGFYHAVDWSERWLLGVAALHVLTWSLVIFTRRSYETQMVLLIVIRAPSSEEQCERRTTTHMSVACHALMFNRR